MLWYKFMYPLNFPKGDIRKSEWVDEENDVEMEEASLWKNNLKGE